MEKLIPAFKIRNCFVEIIAFDLGFEGWSKFRGMAWVSGLGRGILD